MIPISPYDLETGHAYYIECYNKDVRTNKYRGVINNLNACTWSGHNVLEFGNMIEYINGQETTSTERDSPTFPGNIYYIHVNTNATEYQYWLFYKPVADYLMTTQVLKQRTRLDEVSIWGLYKQHLRPPPGLGPNADYLMTTELLRQCTRLDKVSIWGLYKQHLGKARGDVATHGGIPPLRRSMKFDEHRVGNGLMLVYLTPEEKKMKSEQWRFRCAKG
jgi:hypothetical protein